MKQTRIAALLAPLALAMPLPAQAQTAAAEGPSFSCAAAGTAVERAICASPDLAREDRVMARLYRAASKGALGNGHSGLPADQAKWLRERASCEKPPVSAFANREECLRFHYGSRNLALATFAAPHDRSFALAELSKRDPSAAALVEAVLIFADQAPGSKWSGAALAPARGQITRLLTDAFTKLQTDSDQSYGKEILAEKVASLGDAFKSDGAFAETIAILGAYSQSEQVPVRLPCAAMVRNPALLDIESARFGSTIDNFIPMSDCRTTIKPVPALDALVKAIWKSWPQCEGTIRFAGYRAFNQSENAALLGTPIESPPNKVALRRLRGIAPAMVSTAIKELAAHYTAERGYPAGQAMATAQARIGELLDGAHECGG